MQKISARQPKVMRELWKTSIKDRVVRREQRAVRSTHNVGALCWGRRIPGISGPLAKASVMSRGEQDKVCWRMGRRVVGVVQVAKVVSAVRFR